MCNEAHLDLFLSLEQKIVVNEHNESVTSLVPTGHLVYVQITWYFSQKALSITSKCGKYP